MFGSGTEADTKRHRYSSGAKAVLLVSTVEYGLDLIV